MIGLHAKECLSNANALRETGRSVIDKRCFQCIDTRLYPTYLNRDR